MILTRSGLLKRDRPRWIDRYIDYFGEGVLPPAGERRELRRTARRNSMRLRVPEQAGIYACGAF
jgi:hypothetical protein